MNEVFAPGLPTGFKIPEGKPKDWFSYPALFLNVVVNVPQTQQLPIDAGSDFYLTALTCIVTDAAATTAPTEATNIMPLVTLLITDTGSNRQLMQNPVPIPLLTGDGEWPHRLIHPRLFLRNSNIQLSILSFDPNVTYDVLYLNFEGFRIYQ